jgi:hypothetical protein
MDFQDAPLLKITEKERLQNEAFLLEVVRKSDESVKKTVKAMKKAGFSDRDIDLFFNA